MIPAYSTAGMSRWIAMHPRANGASLLWDFALHPPVESLPSEFLLCIPQLRPFPVRFCFPSLDPKALPLKPKEPAQTPMLLITVKQTLTKYSQFLLISASRNPRSLSLPSFSACRWDWICSWGKKMQFQELGYRRAPKTHLFGRGSVWWSAPGLPLQPLVQELRTREWFKL